MPRKILLLFLFAFGPRSGTAQISISDTITTARSLHEMLCEVPDDNGNLSITYSKDSVFSFHYSNRSSNAGKCDVQADRSTPQGNYGPLPMWEDSGKVTKIKMLVYDGYDWSEQPVWVKIKMGNVPQISFSGPTQTLCSVGSAKVPPKIVAHRGPMGWVCKMQK